MMDNYGGMVALGITLAALIGCYLWLKFARRPQLDFFGFSRFDCKEVGNKHDVKVDGRCAFCGKVVISPPKSPLPRK